MQEISGFIPLSGGRIHYLRSGNGHRLLLCFHGYGNSASLFQPFRKYVDQHFTFIRIDLPHHGKSSWQSPVKFTRKDLGDLVTALMEIAGVTRFSMMGYSMGGRVCLTILEMMPQKTDHCLLIAPDGLVFNPLYYFVTRTMVGQRLFRRFLTEPGKYMNLIDWMHRKNWLDASRYRFAMYYLGSETDRSFLLDVWPAMSRIVPDRRRLRAAIRTGHIPVCIYMGVYDKVIPVPHAHRFKKDLASVTLHILEKGHRVFDADSMPQMAQCLINRTC